LSATVNFAVREPVRLGVNCTLMAQPLPGASVAGQAFDCAKSEAFDPEILMFEIFSGVDPVFVNVVDAREMLPTFWVPKSTSLVLKVATGLMTFAVKTTD
jgi:hypothetical protein